MAITTFVAGQVLTAAQLNDSFSTASGLQYINSTTVGSPVSTVSLPNDTFTSTYANYRILLTFPSKRYRFGTVDN
jgi:hypothetical protein